MTKTQEQLLQACYDLGEAQLHWDNADVLGQPTSPSQDRIDAAKSLIYDLAWDYVQESNQ
jgi:hypothetical protein